jgi:hypothetical protein
MVEDPLAVVVSIIFLLILLPVMIAFAQAITNISCSDYKAQIDSKNLEINSLKNEILKYNSTAEFYRQQYENLTNTNITKRDFVDLQNNMSFIQYQINNVNNKIDFISQELINIQNITNFYFTFYFSIAINLLSIGFLLVDFTFFNFDLSKRIAKFVLGKLKKHHSTEHHQNSTL